MHRWMKRGARRWGQVLLFSIATTLVAKGDDNRGCRDAKKQDLTPFLFLLLALIAACGRASNSSAPRPAIALSPCTVDGVTGECGSISVFENRSTNQGRKIDVHAMVLRAEQPGARDAVFMFSGGPGTGSTGMARMTDGWARPIRAGLDIVLVDQRGTGASHPLACPSNAALDPASIFGHVYEVKLLAACRQLLEHDADLTQYTTDRAVADIDDVRAALGYERISLFGSSYGTRVAQAYVRRFPDHVRSVVIDGVAPANVVLPLSYARSEQQALDRVIGACAANPECERAHPRLSADLSRLVARFNAGPLRASVRMPAGQVVPVSMSRGDFAYAVRGMLYSTNAVRTLPEFLSRAAASGNVDEFAQHYWNRHVGFDATLALGQHLSVLCSEDMPFVRDEEVEPATARTVMGRYLVDEYRKACSVWSAGPIAPDARKPLTARVPTLLVSGSFDPVTPPEFAEQVARWLPMSGTIVATMGAHGSSAGCPRDAVLHVLVKGSVGDMPTVCK